MRNSVFVMSLCNPLLWERKLSAAGVHEKSELWKAFSGINFEKPATTQCLL